MSENNFGQPEGGLNPDEKETRSESPVWEQEPFPGQDPEQKPDAKEDAADEPAASRTEEDEEAPQPQQESQPYVQWQYPYYSYRRPDAPPASSQQTGYQQQNPQQQPGWQYYPYHQNQYPRSYPPQPTASHNPYSAASGGSTPPPKKKMDKGLKVFLWIVGSLVGIFLIGFAAYGVYTAVDGGLPTAPESAQSSSLPPDSSDAPSSRPNDSNSSSSQSNPGVNPDLPGLELEDQPEDGMLTAAQVYEKLKDSVVGVVIYAQDAELTSDPLSEGSGVVVREDGYILTNSHVIGDSKTYNIKVVMYKGDEYAGQVVGYDSKTDLAVIKVEADNLVPATLGNSDQLAVGDWVLALGNPGGLTYSSSLTRGIVSAVNRTVNSTSASVMTYIQTDAAINPGNSGGALVNMYGQVVGINTLKIAAEDYEGMGFAIPINAAKEIADDLIRQGYVSGRVRLGITGKAVSEYQAQIYGVPLGFVIVSISDDSDLKHYDVQEGDIITQCNGVAITDIDTLTAELIQYSPGDKVTLTICRPASRSEPEKTFDVEITLLEDKGETQEPVNP